MDGAEECIGIGREAIVGRKCEKRGLGEAGRRVFESERLAEGADLVGHTLGGDAGQGPHVVRHQSDKPIAGEIALFAYVRRGDNDRADQAAIV